MFPPPQFFCFFVLDSVDCCCKSCFVFFSWFSCHWVPLISLLVITINQSWWYEIYPKYSPRSTTARHLCYCFLVLATLLSGCLDNSYLFFQGCLAPFSLLSIEQIGWPFWNTNYINTLSPTLWWLVAFLIKETPYQSLCLLNFLPLTTSLASLATDHWACSSHTGHTGLLNFRVFLLPISSQKYFGSTCLYGWVHLISLCLCPCYLDMHASLTTPAKAALKLEYICITTLFLPLPMWSCASYSVPVSSSEKLVL